MLEKNNNSFILRSFYKITCCDTVLQRYVLNNIFILSIPEGKKMRKKVYKFLSCFSCIRLYLFPLSVYKSYPYCLIAGAVH